MTPQKETSAMTLRQRIIERFNALKPVQHQEAIGIINAAFDEPMSKEEIERVARAICKYEHGGANYEKAWSHWHANFESIAEIAIKAFLGQKE